MWREQLREASFRGVTFLYDGADDRFGKRLAKHQYPGRDEGFAEEMGLDDDSFTLSAFLIEPDHLRKAMDLETALKKPGPGELIHPYLGARMVVFESARRTFTTREGGMVRLDIEFTAVGRNRLPAVRGNTAAAVSTASDNTLNTVQRAFETRFDITRLPGFVAADMTDVVTAAAAGIAGALTPFAAGQDLARLARDAAALADAAGQLVFAPAALAASVRGLAARPLAGGAALAVGLLDLTAAAAPAIPAATATRALQAAARGALTGMVRGTALAAAAGALARAEFETGADAFALLDRFTAAADAEMATADDDVYASIQDMATAATRHVAAVAPALPRLRRRVAPVTEPALVTAQRLFGDDPDDLIDRMEEIVRRNAVRHAGMVPGGETVEVLVRG